jgi:hypothetical protein
MAAGGKQRSRIRPQLTVKRAFSRRGGVGPSLGLVTVNAVPVLSPICLRFIYLEGYTKQSQSRTILLLNQRQTTLFQEAHLLFGVLNG